MDQDNQETQPMLETILREMREGFVKTDARFVEFGKRFDELEKKMDSSFYKVRQTMNALNDTLLEIRTDSRMIQERVSDLEKKAS